MTPHPVDMEALEKRIKLHWSANGDDVLALIAEVRAARQAIAGLKDLLRRAMPGKTGGQGEGEPDRCRACLSYAHKGPHTPDCWVPIADAALASPSVPPPQERVLLEFTPERRQAAIHGHLTGGNVPAHDRQTPEALAQHVEAMVCAFWGWPGQKESPAEMVFKIALGALRRQAALIFEEVGLHGCLTGDCPHYSAPLCVPAIAEYVNERQAFFGGPPPIVSTVNEKAAPPVLEEKAQETAAPKEGGEAAAFVAKLPRAPDVDFEIDPPAVSQQPGVAPAPRRHKCMRCGKEFDCPHGSSCQAKYDVLPRYFLPDGTLVDHCGPLPKQPTAGPPSAPALPREEVAPDEECVCRSNKWCPVHSPSPAAPILPLEEQPPKEGAAELDASLDGYLEGMERRGPAAAPAPGDADRWRALELYDAILTERSDDRSIDLIVAYAARVRSEERERGAGLIDSFVSGLLLEARQTRTLAVQIEQRRIAERLAALAALIEKPRARASDATSAGGGE